MKDGLPVLIYDSTKPDGKTTMTNYFDAIQEHRSLLTPSEIEMAYGFFRDKNKDLHTSAILL